MFLVKCFGFNMVLVVTVLLLFTFHLSLGCYAILKFMSNVLILL